MKFCMLFNKENKEFKSWHLVVLIIIVIVAIAFKINSSIWPKATVQIGGQTIKVLVANTYLRWVEGWSKKNNMGKYSGMLFIYPRVEEHIMVMRDMYFALDIVWLNDNQIIDMAFNLKPEFGVAEDKLIKYYARGPSNRVLELPAGWLSAHNVRIGDVVNISN